MDKNLLVLVDEQDTGTGTMEKLEAHQKGLLHRAFSVLVRNRAGEWLIHRRAEGKYHSEGLWTNTCCSHPMPGEDTLDAAHRRLLEEMGFDCPLEHRFHFIYRKDLGNDLTEHELDHVFTGEFNGTPQPDPEEVSEYRWISPGKLRAEIEADPESFTYWFRIILASYGDQLFD